MMIQLLTTVDQIQSTMLNHVVHVPAMDVIYDGYNCFENSQMTSETVALAPVLVVNELLFAFSMLIFSTGHNLVAYKFTQ